MSTNTTNNTKVIASALKKINATYSNKAQFIVGRELVKVRDNVDKFGAWLKDACHNNDIRYGETYCKNCLLVVSMVDAHGGKYANELETIKFSTLYALASACRDASTKTYSESDIKIMTENVAILDRISESVAKVMCNDIKGGMSLSDAIAKADSMTLDSLKADRKVKKADRKAEKDAEKARIKADAVKGVYESIANGNMSLISELDNIKALIKDGDTDGAINQIDAIIINLKSGIETANAKVKSCELKATPKANTTK